MKPDNEQSAQAGRIRHILMWTYKDSVPVEARAQLEAQLEMLPTLVPKLQRVELGPVVGGRNHAFTHCFVMYFADMEGAQAYQVHPEHVRFAGPFREACETQLVADVDVSVEVGTA